MRRDLASTGGVLGLVVNDQIAALEAFFVLLRRLRGRDTDAGAGRDKGTEAGEEVEAAAGRGVDGLWAITDPVSSLSVRTSKPAPASTGARAAEMVEPLTMWSVPLGESPENSCGRMVDTRGTSSAKSEFVNTV